MKKFFLFVLITCFIFTSSYCFAEWIYKIKKSTKEEDTLYVKVLYTNGNKEIIVDIPVFQPESKEQVHQAIKNRFKSEKKKLKAKDDLDVIKPEIDSDIENSHPTE